MCESQILTGNSRVEWILANVLQLPWVQWWSTLAVGRGDRRQSSLPKYSRRKNQKKINIAAKHSVFGIKWKLCHWGMHWARALYPGESRFRAKPIKDGHIILGVSGHIALSEGFFCQGALHDNGLKFFPRFYRPRDYSWNLLDLHCSLLRCVSVTVWCSIVWCCAVLWFAYFAVLCCGCGCAGDGAGACPGAGAALCYVAFPL